MKLTHRAFVVQLSRSSLLVWTLLGEWGQTGSFPFPENLQII